MSLAYPKLKILEDRAQMLASARAFFQEKGVLEVDCLALLRYPPLDSHIDCIQTDESGNFLHTSPEYSLKKWLAKGLNDCYFLGHVYRKGEQGKRHNPEFTMVEWYRKNFSLDQMIEETFSFLTLFFSPPQKEKISYKKAFEKYIGIDITTASLTLLQKLTESSWDRQTCLDFLLSHQIEPHLGKDTLTALTHYPPDQAGLARLCEIDQELWAERFEVYYQGIELANGFHELSNSEQMRARFEALNQQRVQEGKLPYELDEDLIQSLDLLPDCSGVALGFDRAMMLRHQFDSINSVLPI